MGTDLIWDQDLTFEGVAANYRLGLMRDDPYAHFAFLTVGAFPIQESRADHARTSGCTAAQLGFEWKFQGGSRVRMGAAYYQYDNIAGQRNALDSNLLDYTAPQFLQQRQHTVRHPQRRRLRRTQLYALAADYRLAQRDHRHRLAGGGLLIASR